MPRQTRTYLDLIPIAGPGLALGVHLQPFVLGPDLVAPGSAKAPAALPITGELALDPVTGMLFGLADWGGPTPEIEPQGDLARVVYGPSVPRRATRPTEITLSFYDSEMVPALAACLADGNTLTAGRLAAAITAGEALTLTPEALRRSVVAAVREVAAMNAALLAPQDPEASYPEGRRPLTVPMEEAWTLARLFGRPRIWSVLAAMSA